MSVNEDGDRHCLCGFVIYDTVAEPIADVVPGTRNRGPRHGKIRL